MTLSVEYEAVGASVALMQRPWRTLVSVRGDGRVGFLQGMLSNDVKALAAGDGCPALLLDNKGRVQGNLDLWTDSETISMACEVASVRSVVDNLRKYVLATPVQFQESGDEQSVLGLVGPEVDALLEDAGVQLPANKPYGHVRTSLAGAEVRLARTPALATAGLEIHAPRETLTEIVAALREAANGHLPEVGEETANVIRIEAGLPRQGAELTGEQFPQEARLDAAVNYEKGCYLGQETVARIHYRGSVNRILIGLRAAEALTTGSGLFVQEREVGVVTSSAVSPRLGPIGLGYVRLDFAAAGTELRFQAESSGSLTARVSDLPFQPEGE